MVGGTVLEQYQVFSEPQDLTSFADNIFLYANDNWRVGRDENHK